MNEDARQGARGTGTCAPALAHVYQIKSPVEWSFCTFSRLSTIDSFRRRIVRLHQSRTLSGSIMGRPSHQGEIRMRRGLLDAELALKGHT